MKYLPYEIEAGAGDVVEVVLDRAANVQLLDPENYEKYQHGQLFQYQGGYVTTSPVQLPVPHSGRWYVVIDLGGGPGRVRAAVTIQSGSPT